MLQVSALSKSYATPQGPVPVLCDVSFALADGEAASIMGPSGSGKSTLLYILGALEPPSSGTIALDGRDPFTLPPIELARFRNRSVGFVFQDHCLLPQCSVLENVLTPTLVAPHAADAVSRARELLERVGLGHRLTHRPAELSGGEKQRAALARALVNQPRLVLCDEPTGNLDKRSADAVASLLVELHEQRHTMLVVVTHNPDLAKRFPRRFMLQDATLQPA